MQRLVDYICPENDSTSSEGTLKNEPIEDRGFGWRYNGPLMAVVRRIKKRWLNRNPMLGQLSAQSKEVLPSQAIKNLLTVLLRIDKIY